MTSGQHLGAMPGEIGYVATKGAIQQVARTLAAELAPGLTVNAVNPGATDTGYADPALHEAVRAASPHGRWGQPDDAARLIAGGFRLERLVPVDQFVWTPHLELVALFRR